MEDLGEGLSEAFLLISGLFIGLHYKDIYSFIVSAKSFPPYSEENANHTTAYKMLNDQPLLISPDALLTSYCTPFYTTDLAILTFCYSLEISTLYFLLSQHRYCPILSIFPWLSFLIQVSGSLPLPFSLLVAHNWCYFRNKAAEALRDFSYPNLMENSQKLDLTG